MPSNLFRLGQSDFIKGVVVAVAAALFTYLASALNAPGFSFASLDWAYIMKIAVTAFVGYVGKNFLSDSQGKVFGKIG